jgi:hypothetical protein
MTSMEGLALMFGLILCAVVAEGAVYWRSSHRGEPQDQQREEGRSCASEDRLATAESQMKSPTSGKTMA